ncbi:MAG: hypothetical protein MUF54_11380 [Polyangiaceae bacterium]|jgi:hypothetical protein|nr:hypothetical protein [Polyangiaceae bacterium]
MALWATGMVLASAQAACESPTAKAPTPKRSMDEGRALNIIAQAIRAEGLTPEPPREVTLAGGTRVRMDVGVADKKIGFVYLTDMDARELGNAPVAQKPHARDDLSIRLGTGSDEGVHVVVLFANDYLYDDNAGEEHEATAITAESKLDRDARDFVAIARKSHWP